MTCARQRISLPLISLCLFGVLSSCTSLTSTMLYQDAFHLKWAKRKSHGYPITLRVPTHVKVEIFEKSYVYTKSSPPQPIYDAQGRLLRKYDFRTQILHTDKVFTVDQKRPMAGTINYNTHFSPDHSIEKMQSKLADDSIDQIGLAVSNTLNVLAGQNTGQFAFTSVTPVSNFGDPGGEDLKGERPAAISNTVDILNGDDVQALENVIAAQVFDIDAPDFELQVQSFLQIHLSQMACVN